MDAVSLMIMMRFWWWHYIFFYNKNIYICVHALYISIIVFVIIKTPKKKKGDNNYDWQIVRDNKEQSIHTYPITLQFSTKGFGFSPNFYFFKPLLFFKPHLLLLFTLNYHFMHFFVVSQQENFFS